MKQMNGSITKVLLMPAFIFLLLLSGSVISYAEETVDDSKVVFYVA